MYRKIGSPGEILEAIALMVLIPFLALYWIIYSTIKRKNFLTEWNRPEP